LTVRFFRKCMAGSSCACMTSGAERRGGPTARHEGEGGQESSLQEQRSGSQGQTTGGTHETNSGGWRGRRVDEHDGLRTHVSGWRPLHYLSLVLAQPSPTVAFEGNSSALWGNSSSGSHSHTITPYITRHDEIPRTISSPHTSANGLLWPSNTPRHRVHMSHHRAGIRPYERDQNSTFAVGMESCEFPLGVGGFLPLNKTDVCL
jgi:hypothetical protein